MKRQNLILGVFFLLVITGNIHAAKNDCDKAAYEIEKNISSNDELQKLDQSLENSYREALQRTDIRKSIIKSQRQWLENVRNACSDSECFKKDYEERISELGVSEHLGLVFLRNPNHKASVPETDDKISKTQVAESPSTAVTTKKGLKYKVKTGSYENKPESGSPRNPAGVKKASQAVGGISGKKLTRPRLMSEGLYADTYYSNPPNDELVWSKALLDLKIPGYTPLVESTSSWRSSECNYGSALATLREIQSQLGMKSPYLKTWAANQEKVLRVCMNPGGPSEPPVKPVGKGLPRRAQGDFLYQLGSWNFNRGKFAEALAYYRQVEKLTRTPQRANAAYMVARTLAHLNRAEEAYHKIGDILSDPSLQSIHDNAIHYRFVIMSNMRSFELDLTPKLAVEHLKWLQKTVRLNVITLQDPEKALAIQKDALEQFNIYFPLYAPDTKVVDWWLSDVDPETPRMSAVKTLAPKYSFIDWTQAKWAFNVFDQDWLWALHEKDNPYWNQNRNIVLHAWGKWKDSHDGAWLQIAIQRVHPSDEMAQKILAAAEPYFDRPWINETPEYRQWLFALWANAVRIHLAIGNLDRVFSLFKGHLDFSSLLSFGNTIDYSYRRQDYTNVKEKTLRWLVYTGQFERARSFLDIARSNHREGFYRWRSLLATNLQEVLTVAARNDHYYTDYSNTNDDTVWREMVNLLPSSMLYSLATNDSIRQEYRALMARTLYTRAILLLYGNDQLDRYAALAAKLNPAIREQVLESAAGHNRDKYIGFLLRMPRFRPAVYLEYSDIPDLPRWGDNKVPAIDAIDRYNHNDNNWWCRFDSEMFQERIFNAMKIVPWNNALFTFESPAQENEQEDNEKAKQVVNEELKPYLDNQRRLLASHPYTLLIDRKEIEALENIPSGPQYLCEAVIKREIESRPAKSFEEQNERAANLNRAVRTTRYGCERDGSHGEYSKQAFDLLHERYENTPWAKATPYWFE